MAGTPTRVCLALLIALAAAAPAAAEDEPINGLNTFYFGNSFTGNTMPGLHPLLGRSAERPWKADALISAGVPIWTHMYRLMDADGRSRQKFQAAGADVDAIVMLLFGGAGLSETVTEQWQGKVKFDKPTDIGDVAACAFLIREHLKLNPDGRAYVYTAWPGIPGVRAFRDRLRDEEKASLQGQGVERKEVMKRIKSIDLTHEQLEPLRKSFDYPSHWLNDGYVPGFKRADRDRFNAYARFLREAQRARGEAATPASLAAAAGVDEAQAARDIKAAGYTDTPIDPAALEQAMERYASRATMRHCRAHMYAAMEGLKEEFPELWRDGRLGMIPVGDVFLELDRKMRAGEVPGIVNVGEYYADGGHLRSGLPRYTLAATYYAVLFRDHPKNTDWTIFQDRSNYDSGKFGFYVHQPDLAVHLDITDQRARIVNETIWQVVSRHPYTAMGKAR